MTNLLLEFCFSSEGTFYSYVLLLWRHESLKVPTRLTGFPKRLYENDNEVLGETRGLIIINSFSIRSPKTSRFSCQRFSFTTGLTRRKLNVELILITV